MYFKENDIPDEEQKYYKILEQAYNHSNGELERKKKEANEVITKCEESITQMQRQISAFKKNIEQLKATKLRTLYKPMEGHYITITNMESLLYKDKNGKKIIFCEKCLMRWRTDPGYNGEQHYEKHKKLNKCENFTGVLYEMPEDDDFITISKYDCIHWRPYIVI
mgnify:CR=1 FL=1